MFTKVFLATAVTAVLSTPMAARAEKIGLAMAQLDTFLTILKNGTLDAGKKAGAAFKASLDARIKVEDLVGSTLSRAISTTEPKG